VTAISVTLGAPAKCSSCGADIVWCRTLANKATPMEAAPDGTWVIVGGIAQKAQPSDLVDLTAGPLYRSHFATCPHASAWRKRK
jgi:hypothetical protein